MAEIDGHPATTPVARPDLIVSRLAIADALRVKLSNSPGAAMAIAWD